MANETENTNLKEQILQVAGRMFLEYGYSGTTFQKIADELGITKGSITYHFKNKFLIMEIFIDDFFNQLKAFIDSFPDEYQNIYWRYCVMYIYAYRRIMRTPRNIELFTTRISRPSGRPTRLTWYPTSTSGSSRISTSPTIWRTCR